MAKSLAFGIQKGGVGKTMTSVITASLLSEKFKVLAVDFDSQGSMTKILSGRTPSSIRGKTVLEAIVEKDVHKYAFQASADNENLYVLGAGDMLANLTKYIPDGRIIGTALKETLETVSQDFDFIVIDTPPNLGELQTNSIIASDFVIPVMQTEPQCFDYLPRYLELIMEIRDAGFNVQIAGILPALSDHRTNLTKGILAAARDEYQEMMFETVIKRSSKINEYSLTGVQKTSKADRTALDNYRSFIDELLNRIGVKETLVNV